MKRFDVYPILCHMVEQKLIRHFYEYEEDLFHSFFSNQYQQFLQN